jgi:hypothetical protein
MLTAPDVVIDVLLEATRDIVKETRASSITAIPAYAAPPTIITSTPFTITAPGKYVLHNNLTLAAGVSAIRITCSDVIVDLNGYTITGPGGDIKSFGIEGYNATGVIGALSNIIVRNGTLTNFLLGITYSPGNFQGTEQQIPSLRNITFRGIDSTAISDTKGKVIRSNIVLLFPILT